MNLFPQPLVAGIGSKISCYSTSLPREMARGDNVSRALLSSLTLAPLSGAVSVSIPAVGIRSHHIIAVGQSDLKREPP